MKLEKFAAEQLSKKEMNELKGGTWFNCTCTGNAANPPFKARWGDDYTDMRDIQQDINIRCVYGGNCSQGNPGFITQL